MPEERRPSESLEELVRATVARSLARPLPLVVALGSMWAVSVVGGTLSILLAGISGYLGAAMALLLLAPAVPPGLEGDVPLMLPVGTRSSDRPLPDGLRQRYQRVHACVTEVLGLVPRVEGMLPFEPAALAGIPEEFRRLARLAAARGGGTPEGRLMDRLERIEQSTGRLREALVRLLQVEEPGSDGLEELEGAADELEALADLSQEDPL